MSKRKYESSTNTNKSNYVDMTEESKDSDDEVEIVGTNRTNNFLENTNLPFDVFIKNNESQQATFFNAYNNTSSDFEKFKMIIKRIDELHYIINQGVPNFFDNALNTWNHKISLINNTDDLHKNQRIEFLQLEMEMQNKIRQQTLDQLSATLAQLEALKTDLYRKREVISALRLPENKNLLRFGRKRRLLSGKQIIAFLNKYANHSGKTRQKGINKLAKFFTA